VAESSFLDRFGKLEIPAERRRVDWGFLEAPLVLPRPLPLEEHALLVLVNGRALAPRASAPRDGRSVVFFEEAHALEELPAPEAAEQEYRQRHARELERLARAFDGSVPAAVVAEPALCAEALEALRLGGPAAAAVPPRPEQRLAASAAGHLEPRADGSLLFALAGWSRLLRLHGKLYDLLTLKEYARIFERAIERELFAQLLAQPETVAPAQMLALIEGSLDAVHAKARSPLRNKMGTARLVVNDVTLLPVYREPAAGLWEALARLLDRKLKVAALERRAGGPR
jgi:hypothetical protein